MLYNHTVVKRQSQYSNSVPSNIRDTVHNHEAALLLDLIPCVYNHTHFPLCVIDESLLLQLSCFFIPIISDERSWEGMVTACLPRRGH